MDIIHLNSFYKSIGNDFINSSNQIRLYSYVNASVPEWIINYLKKFPFHVVQIINFKWLITRKKKTFKRTNKIYDVRCILLFQETCLINSSSRVTTLFRFGQKLRIVFPIYSSHFAKSLYQQLYIVQLNNVYTKFM